MVNVIKRNGTEVAFDASKIINAIKKANAEVDGIYQLNDYQINAIADNITKKAISSPHAVNVEDIQDMVETGIMEMRGYEVAQKYVRYRLKREIARKVNTTDESILALIGQTNEELKQENSNKNPTINSTQRDYMAGEVSKDLTKRVLLPEDIVKAHEEGIIHFHDMDYYAQKEHNCDLINLEDMLQNGTVISGTMIEKPHSFFTACNVTTQIVAQVASNQYGGQSFTLSHLAPFVDVSRKKLTKQVIEERKLTGEALDSDIISKIVEKRLGEEIKSGIQTIQYQLITLMTCNGQAPFVTMFMYLDEVPEGQTRDDLARIIREVLLQRMQGTKNEKGIWITPAFPKLIYVLDEDNAYPGSRYYDLTELSARCTAKRMVPDYISAKKMREYKDGDTYPCMGCVDGQEVITYRLDGKTYMESFERAWNRLSKIFDIHDQTTGSCNKYIDCTGVEIYDTKSGFVPCYRFIRNVQSKWIQVTLQNGRTIRVTDDHPFETENRGVVLARDLQATDQICVNAAEKTMQAFDNIESKTEVSCVSKLELFDYEAYSYDVTTASEHFEVSGIYSHNCRSFLTADDGSIGNVSKALNYVPGQHKYYGRFNQGVVTINLVDVACSAVKEADEKGTDRFDEFWKIFDDRLELCHRALRCRHERLLGTVSDVAPILWQYGALARLGKGEKIDPLLFNNYSTISLGYAGLYEMCMEMTGRSHTDPDAKPFALKVMQHMNDKCAEWRKAENISYSLYGTPMESTTYKFAKCLQKRFGIIKDVTDHNYITNSYHVNVREKINAFTKLKFESEFQKLSPGGAISYVEVPNMQNNIPAVVKIIQFIYENIMYAELNTKSDYCEVCGYDGEIKIVEDSHGKLVWECPNCGNRDQTKMSVARRTCGYIGSQYWNRATCSV